MPYALSLREYTKPEFEAVAPDTWERRLRDVSPITPNLSHLRFRKFEARADWSTSPFNTRPDMPLWAVYSATPSHLVHPDRVEQLRLHWSELPKERQVGRKSVTSDYQHFMWHSTRLLLQPLWLLQGEWGGTPTVYTQREIRYLDASGAASEPFPPGFFTPCPFDERSVAKILDRDRMVQACNRMDALEKMDRPAAKKAEDDEAERVYRETYLDTLSVMMAPAVEYMKTQLAKSEIVDYQLPPAPEGLVDTLAQWKEHWKETGKMLNVKHAPQKALQVTVGSTLH